MGQIFRLVKQGDYVYLEQTGTEDSDAYSSMVLVIGVADTLDGASFLDTSRGMEEWLGSQGRQNKHGSICTEIILGVVILVTPSPNICTELG